MSSRSLPSLLPLLLAGCAPTLVPDPVDTGGLGDDTGGSGIEDTVDEDGLTISTLTLDASDYERWVPFDLHEGEIVEEAGGEWEVALQRYHARLAEGVQAAVLDGADFEALTEAPAAGYLTDAPDDDEDGIPEYVLEAWYDYDAETHILTPADRVYVIATPGGDHFRLQFLGYYDNAGSSGRLTVRWGLIHPPSAPE